MKPLIPDHVIWGLFQFTRRCAPGALLGLRAIMNRHLVYSRFLVYRRLTGPSTSLTPVDALASITPAICCSSRFASFSNVFVAASARLRITSAMAVCWVRARLVPSSPVPQQLAGAPRPTPKEAYRRQANIHRILQTLLHLTHLLRDVEVRVTLLGLLAFLQHSSYTMALISNSPFTLANSAMLQMRWK